MVLSRKGQLSLVMIFLVALALIFYAISINWSRVATSKAAVTVASNQGAATLASMVTSYGEYMLQTQLGNEVKHCSSTSMLVSIIVLIVLIIVIVIVSIFSYGGGGVAAYTLATAGGTLMIGLALAAVLTMVSIILQATVIQPGLTKQWNEWQSAISTAEDRFLEKSLLTALTSVVSDPVNVDDRWDSDMDGRWSDTTTTVKAEHGNTAGEQISRFAYYYTDRMKNILVTQNHPEVKTLFNTLKGIEQELGLAGATTSSQKVTHACGATGDAPPASENPCCTPRSVRPQKCHPEDKYQLTLDEKNAGVAVWSKYPDVCDECKTTGVHCTAKQVQDDPTCALPGAQCNILPQTACNIYDPLSTLRRSPNLNLVSVMGMDDANKFATSAACYGNDSARKRDETPFCGYDKIGNAVNAAGRNVSMFDLLWFLSDTGPAAKETVYRPNEAEEGCHWCSQNRDPEAYPLVCKPEKHDPSLYAPQPQLATTCQEANCCISTLWSSGWNETKNEPASKTGVLSNMILDNVGSIRGFIPVLISECANDPSNNKTWKQGSDLYSATFIAQIPSGNGQSGYTDEYYYPIKMETGPNTRTVISACGDPTLATDMGKLVRDCTCSPTTMAPYNINLWFDDGIDNMVAQFATFKQAADTVMSATTTQQQAVLAHNPDSWTQGLTDEAEFLSFWSSELSAWSKSIDNWNNGIGQLHGAYKGSGDSGAPVNDSWCVSSSTTGMSECEISAGNNRSPWPITASNVISCLDWNYNHSDQFEHCESFCHYDNPECPYLSCMPRSLYAGFVPNSTDWPDENRFQKFFSCKGKQLWPPFSTEPLKVEDCQTATCGGSWIPKAVADWCSWTANPFYVPAKPPTPAVGITGWCNGYDAPSDRPSTGNGQAKCNNWTDTSQAACQAEFFTVYDVQSEHGIVPGSDFCYKYDCSTYNCKKLVPPLPPGGDPNNPDIPKDICKSETDLCTNPAGPTFEKYIMCQKEFRKNVFRSIPFAQAAKPKFKMRSDYLKTVQTKAADLQTVFTKESGFLSSQQATVNAQVAAIVAAQASPTQTALGNAIIYGWYGPRPKGFDENRQRGYLHIVKVEAALPKRSTGAYDIGIPTCTNTLPWVRTYTENWGTKRCYELTDHTGCVGLRVVRYDEDHDPNQGGVMKFLSGLPLWQIIYHNPHSNAEIASGDVCSGTDCHSDIFKYCIDKHYTKRYVSAEVQQYYQLDLSMGFPAAADWDLNNAFMLNLPLTEDNPPGSNPAKQGLTTTTLKECKKAAEDRLQRGVFSETCAKYSANSGQFQIKFTKCSECCN